MCVCCDFIICVGNCANSFKDIINIIFAKKEQQKLIDFYFKKVSNSLVTFHCIYYICLHKFPLQVGGSRTGKAVGDGEQESVDEDSFVKVPRSTGGKTEPQKIKATARVATEIYFSKSVGETVGETCREELNKPSSLDFNDSHFDTQRNVGLKVNTKKGKRKKSLGGSFEKIDKADVAEAVVVESPVDEIGFSFFPVKSQKKLDSKKGAEKQTTEIKVDAETSLPLKKVDIDSVESTSQAKTIVKTSPLPKSKNSSQNKVIAKSLSPPKSKKKVKAESKVSVEVISQNKSIIKTPSPEQKISNFEQTNKIDDLPPSSIILHYQKKEVKEPLLVKTSITSHSTSQNGNTDSVKDSIESEVVSSTPLEVSITTDNINCGGGIDNGKANEVTDSTEVHISKPQVTDAKSGEVLISEANSDTSEQETKVTVPEIHISNLNEVTANGVSVIKNDINTTETLTDAIDVTVTELKDSTVATESLIEINIASELSNGVTVVETPERDLRSLPAENTSEQSVTSNLTNQQPETNTTSNVGNDESEINTVTVKMDTNTETRVLTLNANEHQDTVLYRVEQNWIIQFRLGPSLFGHKVILFCNYPQINQQFQRKHYYELQWLQDQGCSHSDDTALYAELVVKIPGSFHYYFTYLNE